MALTWDPIFEVKSMGQLAPSAAFQAPLLPSIDAMAARVISFSFGAELAAGETLGTPVMAIPPADALTIIAGPTLFGAVVLLAVGRFPQVSKTYRYRVIVPTSNPNKVLSAVALLPVVAF